MLSASGKGDDALGAPSFSGNEADTIIWSLPFWGKAEDAKVVDGGAADAALLDSGVAVLDGVAADATVVDDGAADATVLDDGAADATVLDSGAAVLDGGAASASLHLLVPSFSSTTISAL